LIKLSLQIRVSIGISQEIPLGNAGSRSFEVESMTMLELESELFSSLELPEKISSLKLSASKSSFDIDFGSMGPGTATDSSAVLKVE